MIDMDALLHLASPARLALRAALLRLMFFVLLAFTLLVHARPATAQPLFHSHDRIEAVGTSITAQAKYMGLIEADLVSTTTMTLDIRSYGVGGIIAANMAASGNIARYVSLDAPSLVILEFAINEALSTAGVNGYKAGLDAVVAKFPAGQRFVVMSPASCDVARYSGNPATFEANLANLAQQTRDWASLHNIPIADVYAVTQPIYSLRPATPAYTTDGDHDTFYGAQLRAQTLARVLLGDPSYSLPMPCATWPTCAGTAAIVAWKRAQWWSGTRAGWILEPFVYMTAAENAGSWAEHLALDVATAPVLETWRQQVGWQP